MSSQDDPEARIRDLERSLSEQSSELTHASLEEDSPAYHPAPGGDYRPPPPPPYGAPHQPYGVPYPPPMTSSAGGAGRGWIPWVVMAAVLAAIIGGAIMFFANVVSTVGSVVETIGRSPAVGPTVSGGGPFDTPPSVSGGNRPPAPTIAPTPPAGGDISVSGVGDVKTIVCNDSVVDISGVDNRIVITGQCASVSISGVENTVTIESSVQITASGMSNRVTYLSGTPVIDNSGSSNTVEHG